jgi:hypothetical protein|tara:strand:- start:158 stop:535 length:378 start_codon:yes stop_codon:yes gene_type:complete
VTFDVLKLLEQEGYIKDGEDNLLHAEKAFFAARVMKWIRGKAQTDPEFNLTAYLTMLMYYKTGMAELKFSEDGDNIFYKMINPDKEVQDLVDSLIKSSRKDATKKLIDKIEEDGEQTDDADTEDS